MRGMARRVARYASAIFSQDRSRAIVLAVLVLAIPSLAQAPGTKPPPAAQAPLAAAAPVGAAPAVAALANIVGPACTIQQIPVFNAAMVEARTRLAAAVTFVRENPGHPSLRRWFGNAPHQVVLTKLQRTATRLANTAGYDINCNDPARCTPRVGAYARGLSATLLDGQGQPAVTYRLHDGQVLGVCPPFFRAPAEGSGTRWGILVHEATHFAVETQDHAYGWNDCLALARNDGTRAVDNADSYRYFVETLPRT